MNDNINLWFAKDENNKIITIDKASKNNKYTCPICGGEVIPKALNSDMVSPHFAHIDRESCEGESIIHWWTKNNLLKEGDVFSIFTNEEKQYLCKNVIIEKEYDTPYGKYKPDATIECYNGEIIFLEVGFTNMKKKINYINKWTYLNNPVIEFNIRNVYDMDSFEIKINNRFQAIYYDGVKIYKNDKNYESFRRRFDSMNKYEEQLKDIEWFIDDIYEYKITKNEEKLDGIINEIKYIEDNYTYDHAIVVENLLKTKCNSVMKNAIARKDKYFETTIKDYILSLKCDYRYYIEKFEDLRLIWDKLYGDVECEIDLFFDYEKLDNNEINEVIGLINDKYRDIPKIIYDEENGIYIRNQFYLSKKDDVNDIYNFFNEDSILKMRKIINTNIDIYNNYKKKLYVKDEGYIYNYRDIIINDLIDFNIGFIDENDMYKHVPYYNEIMNIEDLVKFNVKESDFETIKIGDIEYIDMNSLINKSVIDDIINKLKKPVDYIISKNNNCKKIEEILGENVDVIFRHGYEFKFNNKNITIDNNGVVSYSDLPILNLGYEYEGDLVNSIEILKSFLEQKISITPYSAKQIKILDKLKNIYINTYNKFEVSLEKHEYVIYYKYKKIVTVGIDKKWNEINKTLSDGVRKYLYN